MQTSTFCSKSPVFVTMFQQGKFKEAHTKAVDIGDVDARVFVRVTSRSGLICITHISWLYFPKLFCQVWGIPTPGKIILENNPHWGSNPRLIT